MNALRSPDEPPRPPRTEKTLVPNGRLALRILNSPEFYGRYQWRDTKRRPLEKQLADFIGGTVVTAAAMRHRREEREEVEREKQRRAAEARRQEREKTLIEDVRRRLATWSEAKDVAALADAVEQDIRATATSDDQISARAAWVTWARSHAVRMKRWTLSVPMP